VYLTQYFVYYPTGLTEYENPEKNIKLDAINRNILATLHQQADRSNQKLAEKVALSASVCFQRTKALKEAGYFINFQTEMDLDRICEHL
jgi:Lrp/AsnC family leucine-responsive transcriptional regulator